MYWEHFSVWLNKKVEVVHHLKVIEDTLIQHHELDNSIMSKEKKERKNIGYNKVSADNTNVRKTSKGGNLIPK